MEENGIIVDVRRPKSFHNGHIPMAINVPLSRIEEGQVTLPKNKVLIVYCDTGGASTKACRLLDEMGYSAINCVGGLENYKGSITR